MDVLLWILLGLGAGIGLTAFTPGSRAVSTSEMARRRLAGVAAGVVGAFAGGYGLVVWDPAARTDGLTTAIAALAGALWLSWIVNVTTSRRRQGEASVPVVDVHARSARQIGMPAYDAARQLLVDGLTGDAEAHDAGRYAEVGVQFAAARSAIPQHGVPDVGKLHVALSFWRAWMRARDRQWRAPAPDDDPIEQAAWPQLARGIASDLALDRDISDDRVRAHFAYSRPSLTAAQSMQTIGLPSTEAGA